MVKIEAELDEREYTALLMVLGAGTGHAQRMGLELKLVLQTVNKLLASQPNFRPYDVESLDRYRALLPKKGKMVQ